MQGDARFADDGRLYSERYGDVYFSGDGVQETEHVFVRGNDLLRRFADAAGTFVIGETGFGTGLNFLVTALAFAQHASARARLVFVSTELHPMSDEVMQKAHATWPEGYRELAAELRRQLAPQSAEASRRVTLGGGIDLYVLAGDATAALREHTFAADAWFLDGFAPARNPEMWSFELLREVARHTAPGGTFATYTVAGQVRRSLQDAGFAIERAPGHGQKREMLKGTRKAATEPANPVRLGLPVGLFPRRVHVLGAGIAGATIARALADRGMEVRVVDPKGAAGGASGIAAAVVRPRLWRAGNPTPDAEMLAQAFRHTVGWLQGNEYFRQCGALLCANDASHAELLQQRVANPATKDLAMWLDSAAASARAGSTVPHGAAWLSTAGTCDLGALTRELLTHERIELRPDAPDERPDLLVQATAAPPNQIGRSHVGRSQSVRGQAIAVRWPGTAPASVLCTDGYLSPPDAAGISWLGSTFDRDDEQCDERPADDEHIRAHFGNLPDIANGLEQAETQWRFVGVRQTSSDRLPMVGLVPGEIPCIVSLAHGSRGAVTAPWAAALLTQLVHAEPLPLSTDYWQRLCPGR